MRKQLLSILCSASILCGCSASSVSSAGSSVARSDSYANVVDSTATDMSDYTSLKNTDTIGNFEEISWAQLLEFLHGTYNGVIYLGYPECPTCEKIIVPLNEAAVETGATIYYVHAYAAPETELYNAILDALDDDIVSYDNDGKKQLEVPVVMAVRDGIITGRQKLLMAAAETDENGDLTEAGAETVKNTYAGIIRSIGTE